MKNNNKSGIATKERIISTCKGLFYEKGYTATTFAEICEKSNVNPGSIAYHFTNKVNIAGKIYNELTNNYFKAAKKYFPHFDKIQMNMLALGIHIKLLYRDPHYRLFSAQYLSERAYDHDLTYFIDSLPNIYPIIKKVMDQQKAEFYFAAYLGMGGYIESYIDAHINELSFEKTVCYYLELYYLFLDKDDLNYRINIVLESLEQLKVNVCRFNFEIQMR